MVTKNKQQQHSHSGQKAKEDHCITPKPQRRTAQCRVCLRKMSIRSTGNTLSSRNRPSDGRREGGTRPGT